MTVGLYPSLKTPGMKLAVTPESWYGLAASIYSGNEDWVRRAAATEPMARPPNTAMSSVRARYPERRRAKVAPKRKRATLQVLRFTVVPPGMPLRRRLAGPSTSLAD